jgi:serpin B
MNRILFLVAVLVVGSGVTRAGSFDAAQATNQVGVEIFTRVRADHLKENLVISPYSIESALALAYVGAAGDTRAEMQGALHFPSDNTALQVGFTDLRTALDAAAQASVRSVERLQRDGERVDVIQWRTANRLYGQDGYRFRSDFLTTMRDGFDAPFVALDFHHAPEQARATINDWVAETTQRRIKDLIPPGAITPDARLVLANALYLKAPWNVPFEPSQTKPEPFNLDDTRSVDVPMMHDTRAFGYRDTEHSTVVTLPYQGQQLQLVIVLPKGSASLDSVLSELTPSAIREWKDVPSRRGKVRLSLPKWRSEGSPLELRAVFEALGIRHAFDEPRRTADFDGIAPRLPDDYLYLSAIYHKTFIAVDEQGTEAAAASAAVVLSAFGIVRDDPIEVRVDHPFLFAIQDRQTGGVLFLGQITDPR